MPGSNNNKITYSYTVDARIRFDKDHFKTWNGIIILATQFLCIGSFVAASQTDLSDSKEGDFFRAIAIAAATYTGLNVAMYMFHICEKFYKFPWLVAELLGAAIFAVAFGIASVLAIRAESDVSVAGILGFICMAAFIAEIMRKSRAIWNGEIAQGTRQKIQQPGQTVC